MKNINTTLIAIMICITFITISCREQKTNTSKDSQNAEVLAKEKTHAIKLEKLQNSPSYEDAVLQMETPASGIIATGSETNFAFTLNNYELGAQTKGSNTSLLANSGKGQHIHFILNNEPYSAHYEPKFKKDIPDGVHHLVAFLSRSYHESVKNENSVVVRKLEVGAQPEDAIDIDMEAPTLIYSRPKGDYAGKDKENLLLDFFVLNTSLSENGNKVRATINGNEFLITEWAPHIIKGLPLGEVTIILELIDAQGNLINGPFNKVTRKVQLKK